MEGASAGLFLRLRLFVRRASGVADFENHLPLPSGLPFRGWQALPKQPLRQFQCKLGFC